MLYSLWENIILCLKLRWEGNDFVSRIKRTVRNKKQAVNKKDISKQKTAEVQVIPEYTIDGTDCISKRCLPLKRLTCLLMLCLLLGALYLPPLFYSPSVPNNQFFAVPDIGAVRKANEYIRDHPDLDQDQDGLPNYLEQQFGTSCWNMDSDNDGISDYTEIYIMDTDPKIRNTGILEKETEQLVEAQDGTAKSPYTIYNVILWADDLYSRSYGGVVRTLNGYRFCRFKGWAQFPTDGFAYKLTENGITPLERHGSEKG